MSATPNLVNTTANLLAVWGVTSPCEADERDLAKMEERRKAGGGTKKQEREKEKALSNIYYISIEFFKIFYIGV